MLPLMKHPPPFITAHSVSHSSHYCLLHWSSLFPLPCLLLLPKARYAEICGDLQLVPDSCRTVRIPQLAPYPAQSPVGTNTCWHQNRPGDGHLVALSSQYLFSILVTDSPFPPLIPTHSGGAKPRAARVST